MKFEYNNWDIGGKAIFIATCASAFSLFLPWAELGMLTNSGWNMGAWWELVCFLFPLYSVLQGEKIGRIWRVIYGVVPILGCLQFIGSKSIELSGETKNLAGSGAYLCLFASFALCYGVFKYKVGDPGTAKIPEVPAESNPKVP